MASSADKREHSSYSASIAENITRDLSLEELKELRDAIRSPLNERSVLIPCGSKAFMSGLMQPAVRDGEEQVLVKCDNDQTISIARSKAKMILDERIEELSGTKKPPANEKIEQPPLPQESLPMFEIQEEIDSSGKTIRSEAINVAQHLQFIQRISACRIHRLLSINQTSTIKLLRHPLLSEFTTLKCTHK